MIRLPLGARRWWSAFRFVAYDWVERWGELREHAAWSVRYRVMGCVCKVVGHAGRGQGVWPEDKECPRCGDTIIECGFTMEVVPPIESGEATTSGGEES